MNKERVLALAALIEMQPHDNSADAESGFGMSNWFHNCGTPSCIAGFARTMAEAESSLNYNPTRLVAADYLGLDSTWCLRLFTPSIYPRPWSNITPAMAATALRRIADAGDDYINLTERDLWSFE